MGENTCACPDGWTGYGDFVAGTADCDVFVPAVSALWAVAILANAASFGINARVMCRRRCARGASVHERARGRVRSGEQTPPQRLRERGVHIRDFLYFETAGVACANVCFMALGALRIAQPLVTIGTGVAVTVLLALGTIFFWVPTVAVLGIFITISATQARAGMSAGRLNKTIRGVRLLLPSGIACAFLAAALPLSMLGTESQKPLLASLHYGAVAFLLVGPLMLGHLALSYPIIRDLRFSIDAMRNQPDANAAPQLYVVRILERVLAEALRSGTVQSILCLLFASFPWLLRKSSYMQPIAWINGGFSGVVIGSALSLSLKSLERPAPHDLPPPRNDDELVQDAQLGQLGSAREKAREQPGQGLEVASGGGGGGVAHHGDASRTVRRDPAADTPSPTVTPGPPATLSPPSPPVVATMTRMSTPSQLTLAHVVAGHDARAEQDLS